MDALIAISIFSLFLFIPLFLIKVISEDYIKRNCK